MIDRALRIIVFYIMCAAPCNKGIFLWRRRKLVLVNGVLISNIWIKPVLENSFHNDKLVIGELCGSFERQLSFYKELRDTVRSTLSKLILSRGDAAALMAGVEKKKRLLDSIEQERIQSSKFVEYWQERRSELALEGDAVVLNGILTQMESVIKEFLSEEDKLKVYLEKMCKKGGGGQNL